MPGEPARYVAVEVLLKRFSHLLFPGYDVLGSAAFRVLRDSDLEIEEEAEDLVLPSARRSSAAAAARVIRLEMEDGTPELGGGAQGGVGRQRGDC